MGIDDGLVLLLGLMFAVAGCGNDTIVASGAGGSAGGGAAGGASGSGGAAALACDPTQPFANIARVPGVADSSFSGRPSDDGLSLLLDVFSPTANDTVMHRATRPAITDPFGSPAMVDVMGGVQRPSNGIVTFDGQTLLFQGFEAGPIQLYAVAASVLQGGNEPPTLLSLYGLGEAPYPSGDGSRIYFDTDRAGGPFEIWTAVRQGSDYVSPEPLASINVATEDRFAPVVSRDGLAIYFAARAAGDTQIYVSIRSSADDPFGPGDPVPSLASSAHYDIPTWLSADGCTLYFESNRDGVGAIYSASLPPP